MPDTTEWIGLLAFAVLIGAFLGFVVTQGSVFAGVAGAVVLALLSAVYLFTIADQGGPPDATPK